ncbi:MAG TPA: Arm DNA-binding domain-containing protein, partial [Steroidobacteraceae bacterium]|nr:Arm DNA-binding domain-containing protein [Steroidobacteraceae bacterium]
MALSDKAVSNAKAGPKKYRLFDGDGLYLEVSIKGGKYWRLKYRFSGKEKCLALGVYPRVGLKLARRRSDEARQLLTDGVDPGEQKKIARAAGVEAAGNSFEAIALEWLIKQKPTWAESHWTR